jgi:membrane-bound lytic murein transglycosylase D
VVLMPTRTNLSTALAQAAPIASIGSVDVAASPAANQTTAVAPVKADIDNVADIESPVSVANTTASADTVLASALAPATTVPSTPSGTSDSEDVAANPEAPTTTGNAPRKHQVRNGDTLWSIAKHYGMSLLALRRLNGLGPNARLKPGQSIKLLP